MSKIWSFFFTDFSRFWTPLGSQVGLMLGLCWPQTLKKATSKTTQKKHQKQKASGRPGNEILGALNNTENNPVQATTTENTPSQLAMWRICLYMIFIWFWGVWLKFSDDPSFWILNVRPEIRTFDQKFEVPPKFSDDPFFWILNVRPEIRTFDRKFERSTGNSKYHRNFRMTRFFNFERSTGNWRGGHRGNGGGPPLSASTLRRTVRTLISKA